MPAIAAAAIKTPAIHFAIMFAAIGLLAVLRLGVVHAAILGAARESLALLLRHGVFGLALVGRRVLARFGDRLARLALRLGGLLAGDLVRLAGLELRLGIGPAGGSRRLRLLHANILGGTRLVVALLLGDRVVGVGLGHAHLVAR